MEWETVIGLEIHAQLNTNSKLFSGAATAYGAEPNTQACAIDLGLPGILPVLNKAALEMGIKFGLAIHAKVNRFSQFARKNYFYPDLPKGYQITQHSDPIVSGGGYINIVLKNGETKRIDITRAQLEEDTGKSLHEAFPNKTGIDFNRAGLPLLEIVTEPVMRSAEEAVVFLKTLHTLLRYLDICEGNMQESGFRCDANISVRPKGTGDFGTRTEIKNINSFKFVERAIQYESKRQIEAITHGKKIIQETRLFDSSTGETRSMREKENVTDYRYFPDPDLMPVKITELTIENIRKTLPELPEEKKNRFIRDYSLSPYDANLLILSKSMADYFEAVITHTQAEPKLIANWILGEISALMNKYNILDIQQIPITSQQLGKLLNYIHQQTISGTIAKSVFDTMWHTGQEAEKIIAEQNLAQISDVSALEKLIDQVLVANPHELNAYKAGKIKLLGFFVGEVMKASGGKANPKELNQLLREKLT